ncbi:hypothetical protein PPYR_05685 [Photinus pyralis]|uniref:Hexosyltransferase n=1 Tax=Photinus pyralis TaxID=7054 RepID=A0A5N4AVG5_PHOPY|nr:hypothetical protein PPYR_05685 [Photinus pyralis]
MKSVYMVGVINIVVLLYMTFWVRPTLNPFSPKNAKRLGLDPPLNLPKLMRQFILNKTSNGEIYATLNGLSCPKGGEDIQVVIVVPSAPFRDTARMAVRRTWGRIAARNDVSIYFLIGKTSNSTLRENIEAERYTYGDILIGNFTDTYNNLTLKSISMLRWVKEYCPRAKYLLKCDDDVFLNAPRLLKLLSQLKIKRRAIYGRVFNNRKPMRDNTTKHFVPYEEYKFTVYPHFVNGPAYIIPVPLVEELYNSCLRHKIVRLEDMFLTGIVATNLNIRRLHVEAFQNGLLSLPCFIQRSICIHRVRERMLFEYWQQIFDRNKKCKYYLVFH